MSRALALAVLAVLLAGCPGAVRWGDEPGASRGGRTTSAGRPATHTVKSGESLFAIALRYDLSASDLALWNRLGSGELIFPGQSLRLSAPPGTRAPAPDATQKSPSLALIAFRWPTKGTVVNRFDGASGLGKGIDIEGKADSPIFAAAAGRVVYSGDGLIGYGNLIIVKHSERYLSAYGYNKALLVKEGDQVQAGQRIGTMGKGRDGTPLLHFEIREHGKPVDPLAKLPTP